MFGLSEKKNNNNNGYTLLLIKKKFAVSNKLNNCMYIYLYTLYI